MKQITVLPGQTSELPKAPRSGSGVSVSVSQTEAQRGEPDLSGLQSLKGLPAENLGGFPGQSRLSHDDGDNDGDDNDSSLYFRHGSVGALCTSRRLTHGQMDFFS